jgi:hypothetical protein
MAEIDLETLSTPEHGYTVDDTDDDDPRPSRPRRRAHRHLA